METLTHTDASLLAILADRPGMTGAEKSRLVQRLTETARPIGDSLISGHPDSRTEAGKAAAGIRRWSEANRKSASKRLTKNLGPHLGTFETAEG